MVMLLIPLPDELMEPALKCMDSGSLSILIAFQLAENQRLIATERKRISND